MRSGVTSRAALNQHPVSITSANLRGGATDNNVHLRIQKRGRARPLRLIANTCSGDK
jgi:hypothetical protein